jgi:hypothetical protein
VTNLRHSLLLVVLAACGANEPRDTGEPEPAVETPSLRAETAIDEDVVRRPSIENPILREIRARRDALDALGVISEPVDRGGDLDLSSLAGVSRAEVESALGADHACFDDGAFGVCTATSEWVYPLHRLPDGWLGGGSNVVFTFEGDTVRGARWLGTQ